MEVHQFLRFVQVKEDGFKIAKNLYADRLAPDFSPFEFFGLDEMGLSKLLAWLLNPRGSHGQGGQFLYLFLKTLSAAWPLDACEQAQVQTESCINEGRIDIQITSGRKCCIIENKPRAADGPDQVKRYFKELDRLRANEPELPPSAYPLVYLTPNGSLPTSYSMSGIEQQPRIEAGQLHCWAYRGELLDWVTQCRATCRADRVAVFIDEFSRYIHSHFGGVKDMTLQDQLVDEITASPAMVSSAMHVALAANAIREKLLSKLRDEIVVAVSNEHWELDWKVSEYNRWSGFNIDFSKRLACMFRLEFGKTQYNNVAYGAYKRDPTTTDDKGTRAALIAAKLNNGKGSAEDKHWPWWRSLSPQDNLLPFEENWQISAQPWIAIADGTMARAITATARRFRDALASADV